MEEDEHKDKEQVSERNSKLTALNSSIDGMIKKRRVKNKPSSSSSSLHQTVPTLNNDDTKTNGKNRRETARRKDDDDETLSAINTTYGDIESILLDSPEKMRSPLSTPTPTRPLASPSPSPSQRKQRQYEDGIVDWSDESNELDEVIFDLDFRTELSWDWKEDVHTVEAVTREGPIMYGVVRW